MPVDRCFGSSGPRVLGSAAFLLSSYDTHGCHTLENGGNLPTLATLFEAVAELVA